MLGNQQNQEEDVNTLKIHKFCRCVPPSEMSNTGWNGGPRRIHMMWPSLII